MQAPVRERHDELHSFDVNSVMATHPAIRFVASSGKSARGLLHLQCHVKPGASKQREGIMSVSDAVIEVCVSAQPRDGEANKAVREVISRVREFLEYHLPLIHLTLAGPRVSEVRCGCGSRDEVTGQDGRCRRHRDEGGRGRLHLSDPRLVRGGRRVVWVSST